MEVTTSQLMIPNHRHMVLTRKEEGQDTQNGNLRVETLGHC